MTGLERDHLGSLRAQPVEIIGRHDDGRVTRYTKRPYGSSSTTRSPLRKRSMCANGAPNVVRCPAM